MQLSRDEPVGSTALTAHRYTLSASPKTSAFSFTAHFSPAQHVPSFPAKIQEKNLRDWNQYWEKGGFLDLTASSNPNATELQRRIITSQYHVRVNSAAKGQSPQESGLMNNGWYGKCDKQLHWQRLYLIIYRKVSYGDAYLAQRALGDVG